MGDHADSSSTTVMSSLHNWPPPVAGDSIGSDKLPVAVSYRNLYVFGLRLESLLAIGQLCFSWHAQHIAVEESGGLDEAPSPLCQRECMPMLARWRQRLIPQMCSRSFPPGRSPISKQTRDNATFARPLAKRRAEIRLPTVSRSCVFTSRTQHTGRFSLLLNPNAQKTTRRHQSGLIEYKAHGCAKRDWQPSSIQ